MNILYFYIIESIVAAAMLIFGAFQWRRSTGMAMAFTISGVVMMVVSGVSIVSILT